MQGRVSKVITTPFSGTLDVVNYLTEHYRILQSRLGLRSVFRIVIENNEEKFCVWKDEEAMKSQWWDGCLAHKHWLLLQGSKWVPKIFWTDASPFSVIHWETYNWNDGGSEGMHPTKLSGKSFPSWSDLNVF